MGYAKADIEVLPEGADLGLGCGNPQAIANLKPGETVVDLGSGGGIDCFLAARGVGEQGHVIGVDMTPEMIYKARANRDKVGLTNVEFRLGEIEHVPVESDTVDVIMSNCVINLSPDKPAVFREAFRILKAGGRLAISDVVATRAVPESIRKDAELWSACGAGALPMDELTALLTQIGFKSVRIDPIPKSSEMIKEWTENPEIADYFVSANIEAVK
jgi:ubiquinone/menaquinone biosynthesis C-methylase UbiE